MLRSLNEWYDNLMERGSSGEKAYQIMEDWREERMYLLNKIKEYEEVNKCLHSLENPKQESCES